MSIEAEFVGVATSHNNVFISVVVGVGIVVVGCVVCVFVVESCRS